MKASVLRHSSCWRKVFVTWLCSSVTSLASSVCRVWGRLENKVDDSSFCPSSLYFTCSVNRTVFMFFYFLFTFIENLNRVVKMHSGFESGELLDTQKRACLWREMTVSGSRRASSWHHSHPVMKDVVCIKLLNYPISLHWITVAWLFCSSFSWKIVSKWKRCQSWRPHCTICQLCLSFHEAWQLMEGEGD